MSIIDTLITDRTEEDIQYAQQLNTLNLASMSSAQLTEYLAGLKGTYNAVDLNRVETAVEYLVEKLKNFEIFLTVDTKTSWNPIEWMTPSEATRYLDNISTLRSCFAIPSDMPEVPYDLENLTIIEANNIEKILVMVNDIMLGIARAWFYSGDIYSGEV